ncbi:MAG: nitronate monooxygenase [Pseudomonadota bacterium]
MKTSLTEQLGIELPIVQAPIGGAAVPTLVSAVSNAGGLGTLTLTGCDTDTARARIRATRALTDKPFAVNALLPYEGHFEDALDVALGEQVAVVNLFWGDAGPWANLVHDAGALLSVQVGSVTEAEQAVTAGADLLVAQGWGAGGHVRGNVDVLPFVTTVLDKVKGVPVVAGGGIADGRGLAAVLAAGASGACIGTRFLAAAEADVADTYREHVLKANQADTVYTTVFDRGWPDAPHRVLRNSTYLAWAAAGGPPRERRPGAEDVLATDGSGHDVQRYLSHTATSDVRGDVEALALWAGQGVGLVQRVQPAAEIVAEIAEEARQSSRALAQMLDESA